MKYICYEKVKVKTLIIIIPIIIHISNTSCRKGEHVYKTKLRYTIESILIRRCRITLIPMFVSGYIIDVKTKNMEIIVD